MTKILQGRTFLFPLIDFIVNVLGPTFIIEPFSVICQYLVKFIIFNYYLNIIIIKRHLT